MTLNVGDAHSVGTFGTFVSPTSTTTVTNGGVSLCTTVQQNNIDTVNFNLEDTIQIKGDINSNISVSGVSLSVKVYRIADNQLMSTVLSSSIALTSGVSTNFETINGSILTYSPNAGNYYVYSQLSHTDIQDATSKCLFAVGQVPQDTTSATTPSNSDLLRNAATTYADNFNILLESLGKTVYVLSGTTDCPNCYFDRTTGKSNGVYDTNNTHPANTRLNREFHRGQTCPVCGGEGRISEWTAMTALVAWENQNMRELANLDLASKTATIKVKRSYYNTICNSDKFRVPTPDNQYIVCKRTTDPRGFGIGSQAFASFHVEAST